MRVKKKAIEGAIQETNSQEISRFNNYIDAIYKRMNAALRAKLMDPMVLNLQGKDKKDGNKKKVKDAKKRVDRDVEDEEILMNQLWRKNKWKMNLKLTLKWKLTIEQENQNQNRKEIKKIKKKNGKRTRTKKEKTRIRRKIRKIVRKKNKRSL